MGIQTLEQVNGVHPFMFDDEKKERNPTSDKKMFFNQRVYVH
jgi:hypothetical protein